MPCRCVSCVRTVLSYVGDMSAREDQVSDKSERDSLLGLSFCFMLSFSIMLFQFLSVNLLYNDIFSSMYSRYKIYEKKKTRYN